MRVSRGRGLRLLVCVAAVVAVVGLHAYGARSLGVLQSPEPHDVIVGHVDGVAGALVFRTEKPARDDVDRAATWFASLFALGASAIGLLAVGHRRQGVVLAGARQESAVPRPSSSPRAPPLALS